MDKTKEEMARELRNEYTREYSKKNPDKKREINKRYWLKKVDKMLEGEANKC